VPAPLPAGALRLFGHYDPGALDPRRAAPFLIGRLLEDGDAADLRWLAATFAEAELAAWLARHGSRALSLRSLAFWRLVFGDGPADPARERFSRASLPPGEEAVGEGGRPGGGRVRSSRTFDLWPL
jgi:hypothetical protein